MIINMKLRYALVILCFASICLSACGKKSEVVEICGYVAIDEDKLKVDTVEWITSEDKGRIKELGLTEGDLPDGYYILNDSKEIATYKIDSKTQFNFIDWGNDFVAEGEDQNISTTNKEEFIKYLNTYSDQGANQPFFIEIKDNVVISITEKPMA